MRNRAARPLGSIDALEPRAQLRQRLDRAAQLVQQRRPLAAQRLADAPGDRKRLENVQQLLARQPAAAPGAQHDRADVVRAAHTDVGPPREQVACLVGLVEQPRDDGRVARRRQASASRRDGAKAVWPASRWRMSGNSRICWLRSSVISVRPRRCRQARSATDGGPLAGVVDADAGPAGDLAGGARRAAPATAPRRQSGRARSARRVHAQRLGRQRRSGGTGVVGDRPAAVARASARMPHARLDGADEHGARLRAPSRQRR